MDTNVWSLTKCLLVILFSKVWDLNFLYLGIEDSVCLEHIGNAYAFFHAMNVISSTFITACESTWESLHFESVWDSGKLCNFLRSWGWWGEMWNTPSPKVKIRLMNESSLQLLQDARWCSLDAVWFSRCSRPIVRMSDFLYFVPCNGLAMRTTKLMVWVILAAKRLLLNALCKFYCNDGWWNGT